jgi:hypothetical protein
LCRDSDDLQVVREPDGIRFAREVVERRKRSVRKRFGAEESDYFLGNLLEDQLPRIERGGPSEQASKDGFSEIVELKPTCPEDGRPDQLVDVTATLDSLFQCIPEFTGLWQRGNCRPGIARNRSPVNLQLCQWHGWG